MSRERCLGSKKAMLILVVTAAVILALGFLKHTKIYIFDNLREGI